MSTEKEARLTELQINHFCLECGGTLLPGAYVMRAVLPLKVSQMLTSVGIAWCRSCWLEHMGPSGARQLQEAEETEHRTAYTPNAWRATIKREPSAVGVLAPPPEELKQSIRTDVRLALTEHPLLLEIGYAASDVIRAQRNVDLYPQAPQARLAKAVDAWDAFDRKRTGGP